MQNPSPTFTDSTIVTSPEDMEWILNQLPGKVKTLTLLFSSAKNGWKLKDWQAAVKDKQVPMTITLFRSTKGKVSGGYLHIPWKNDDSRSTFDDKALIFSVTHRTLFRPTDNNKAVYFSNFGP